MTMVKYIFFIIFQLPIAAFTLNEETLTYCYARFFSLFLAFRHIIYPALIWFPDITLSSNSHTPIQIKYIINQESLQSRTEVKIQLLICSYGLLSTIY